MWICILCISIFSLTISKRYIVFLILWSIIIIINGNVKKIYSEKYRVITIIIKRTLYVVPLLLPLLLHVEINIISKYMILWGSIGTCIGFIFLTPKIKVWKMLLDEEFICCTKKKMRIHYITSCFMYLFGAIAEEIFFRGFIIEYVCDRHYIIGIFLSTIVFFMNHFYLKWREQFSKYDYIVQCLFGFVSSCVFLYSGCIISSIMMHITYNMPHIIKLFKEYQYHYL